MEDFKRDSMREAEAFKRESMRETMEAKVKIANLISEVTVLNANLNLEREIRREKEKMIRSQSERIEQLEMLQHIQKILSYQPDANLRGRISRLDENTQEEKNIILRHLRQANIIGGVAGAGIGFVGVGAAGVGAGAGTGAGIGDVLGLLGGPFAPITVPVGAAVGAIISFHTSCKK